MEKHKTLVAERAIEMLENQTLAESKVVAGFSCMTSETVMASFVRRCVDRGLPITTLRVPVRNVH